MRCGLNPRTDDLFLRAAFRWFQAGAGGQQGSISDETLAIGRDTHVMNHKAFKVISVQYLKDIRRDSNIGQELTLPVRSWRHVSGRARDPFSRTHSPFSQFEYLPQT
jgi:hypothetical protein